MAQPTTSIKLNGPLFDAPRQFSLGLQEAVDRGLLDIAQFEGANKVKEQLWGPPASQYKKVARDPNRRGELHGAKTRNLRNHIGAKMTDHVAQFDAGETLAADGRNLVYASWVEGISARNQSSSFKGYKMFQNAYDHIDNNPKLYEKYIGDAIIEALE